MNLTWVLVTTYSLAIPAVIGWVRFKRIHPSFYPFLLFIWLGLINEVISTILIYGFRASNAINSNIYVLIEALLILWQFEKWGSFSNAKKIYPIGVVALASIWLSENFITSQITSFCSYFMILYSGIICLLSIHQINYIVVRERKNILLNSVFLICATFILYYAYKAMVESFWLYGSQESSVFKSSVYRIHAYINLLSNCIFALAILWAPRKQVFSLPSL